MYVFHKGLLHSFTLLLTPCTLHTTAGRHRMPKKAPCEATEIEIIDHDGKVEIVINLRRPDGAGMVVGSQRISIQASWKGSAGGNSTSIGKHANVNIT
mmetsp:Transcript_7591/g.12103  ORF Transcript_7591/g.12103 Transcript_7591/m.12103 type:complete len:98 (-) Transcript_7591:900-1193(-)